MSQLTTFSRYKLIINKLRKKEACFEEIKDYLQREFNLLGHELKFSRRTLQRDLKDIYALFCIDIQFYKPTKAYKIQSTGQPEFDKRALEAFDMFHALNVTDNLSPFIHFEKRKPKGTEYFNEILQAIKHRRIIHFEYYKFEDDVITYRSAAPYALKEFKGRWYLIAEETENAKIKTFGLDRITALETDPHKTFTLPSDFNAEAMFRNSFGIYSADIKKQPQEIILAFDYLQGQYIKTYPLHETQKLIAETDDEVKIQLQLHITHDLKMELLSYGNTVKVIAPAHLKQKLKEVHLQAADLPHPNPPQR